MKRIVCLMLAVFCLLGLCACGDKSSSDEGSGTARENINITEIKDTIISEIGIEVKEGQTLIKNDEGYSVRETDNTSTKSLFEKLFKKGR